MSSEDEIPESISSVEDLMKFLAARYSQSNPSDAADNGVPETPSVPVENDATTMFALIIGINAYPEKESGGWKPLKGAVADATAMKEYLIKKLRVPDDGEHIKTLFNEEATLEGIQNAFLALAENPKIQKDDPILIFYAGHGSQVNAPDNWPVGDKNMQIQMLVPVDVFYKRGDHENNRARGVLDMTLGYLLAKLASKKGNNITVIFDCCNSGSATRGEEEEEETGDVTRFFEIPEGVELDFTFPAESTELKEFKSSDGFLVADSGTHVILSACRHDEKAAENQWAKPPRGRFTVALLDLLEKEGANTLTYKDIIGRIPPISAKQNPQCEGKYRDRIMFDAKAVGKRNIRYVQWSRKDGFTLQAGEANGVRPGTRYTVYSDSQLSKLLGTLEVQATYAFTSKLRVPSGGTEFTLPAGTQGFAVKAKVGQPPDVSVYIPFDNRLIYVWDKIYEVVATESQFNDIAIEYVEPQDQMKADLILDVTDDDRVQFSIVSMGTDSAERLIIPEKRDIDPDDIYTILHSAAHFSYHLRRTSTTHELRESGKIRIECNQLFGGDWQSSGGLSKNIYVPERVGDNLIQVDNTLTVYSYNESSDDPIYAFRLFNHTDLNLYVNIFFFDLDTLAIDEFFTNSTSFDATRAEESLPKQTADGEPGSLILGYGSGGIGPRKFSIPGDLEVSHGVLKIFLSTQSVDLSDVKQDSPFGPNGRGMDAVTQRPAVMWDTISVSIKVVYPPNA